MTDIKNITIHLTEAQHLFTLPEVTPLSPQWRNISGVEQIYQEWLTGTGRRGRTGRLTLYLASPGDVELLPEQIRAALKRYSRQEIEQNEAQIKFIRRMARKTTVIGLTILASFLISAVVVDYLVWLPVWLTTLLHESFIIAGWVALWWPAELIFYEWWPFKLRIYFLQYLNEVEVEILLESNSMPIYKVMMADG